VPRAGLSTAVVVGTAAELADEAGWDQLTLAAVAARLSVRQPSLYKHIGSLAELRRAVSVLAVTEIGDRLVVAVAGRSGVDALTHLAIAYRGYAHRHPGRYAASVIAPAPGDREHTRVADGVLRTLAAVLRGYGFPDIAGNVVREVERAGDDEVGAPGDAPAGDTIDGGKGDGPASASPADTLHAIRGLRAMLHGFVALEAAGGFGMPLDLDVSYRRLVAGLDAALTRQGAGAGPSGEHDRATTVVGL